MKLRFSPNLEYQQRAIASVVDILEGSQASQSDFEISFAPASGMIFGDLGFGNSINLDSSIILKNAQSIQMENGIAKSEMLIMEGDVYNFPNFSVEMETGTGKTYVYLRTIFELSRKYGLKKFIIVVPSVAVREGVLSSIRIMGDHFKNHFSNLAFDYFVYSSDDLSKVRQFAVSNQVQIMIINIQAFQRDATDIDESDTLTDEQKKKLNIIHQEQDKMSGRRPIDYIQATNPILIIDEPQSVDNTPKAKRAIKTLNPLFALRYSATLNDSYNLLYRLDPIRAYEMKLVKQIEISSISAERDFNKVFIRIESIGYAKNSTKPHAKATIFEDTSSGPKEKRITLKHETDVGSQTNRSDYDGYIVSNISAEEGFERVEFSNGVSVQVHQEQGGMADDIMKQQIRQTIEEHLKKEKKYKEKGIKVLSLFFVDKVANYRGYDDQGNPQKGKLAVWFEDAYNDLLTKPQYQDILKYSASEVHDGYFSSDKKKGKIVSLKDTSGSTKDDDDTYKLIMSDKERLLSNEEPLRFIFSHSALREGWDNPNIFQICSLREMGTDRQRRQTLGRGLRLPVNQNGERIYDASINRLTVIASESFEEYADGLQKDIEQDIGGGFKFGRIEKIGFARIIDTKTEQVIGQEQSEVFWNKLVELGYLTTTGDITNKFSPEKDGFKLELPDSISNFGPAITDELRRYIFKSRIANVRDRKTLKFNKRVELNENFKMLWEKINKKTKFSVEFKTYDLVLKAVDKVKKMPPVQPVKILINKTELELDEAGVEGGKVLESKSVNVESASFIPDILANLQRETELTRGTLVEILKKSGRLKDFFINPQSFMTEIVRLLKRSLQELVIDGIKYEKIEGSVYEMRLFEQLEVEEYLSRLYQVQSKDHRTPYDFIPFDSEVERDIAEKLDSDQNVKFFCKLPRWFKIQTPMGTYNPDWAVVTESDTKLYLVRESKSTHDREGRLEKENLNIDCGNAHFKALGVNFRVATNIHEVLREQ